MDQHEGWKKPQLALWCLGRTLGAPDHKFQDACSYAVSQSIKPTNDVSLGSQIYAGSDSLTFQVVYSTDSFLCVLDDFREEEGERRCGHLGIARLVERTVIDVWTVRGWLCSALDGSHGGKGEARRGGRRGKMVDGGVG